MIKFYDILLTILRPFIMIGGKIGLPKRHFTGEDYYKFRDSILPGDVLLTKSNFELSNLYNPTELKHAGIYVGRIFGDDICYVFESTAKGAILTDLVTFLLSKDIVINCRMNALTRSDLETSKLHGMVMRYKGVAYDYLFSQTGKAFYCFELAAECLRGLYPHASLKTREVLKGKKIYDHNTFLDPQFFTVVFDTRKV